VFYEPHNPLLFSDAFFWVCLGAFRKRSNVVRLRGLPFSASEADIADFFKGLEKGPDGVVVCVNFQGRSTGQAYVQFATAELANKALDRNRQHIGSRYIEVFKGHPADMQGALRMVGRGGGTSPGSATAVVSGTGTASNMTAALTGILNTGIPGMSGNPDMRYIGVVRMRGMPYRLAIAFEILLSNYVYCLFFVD
jgi:hypothetical protein